ncbi:MAG: heat-shock protein, partial [Acetobacter persici]
VTGADMNNGLLRISVRQIVPEALKPRRISVQSGAASELTPKAETSAPEQPGLHRTVTAPPAAAAA